MANFINGFKIDKGTLQVSYRSEKFITDSSSADEIAADIRRNTSQLRPKDLEDKILEVTGNTSQPNARPFTIKGNIPDRMSMSEGKIKSIEVDGNKYNLEPELKVEIKISKSGRLELEASSLKKIEELADNGTVKQSMFGERIRLNREKSAKAEPALGNTEKAMLAASNEASSLKEAAQLTASNNSNFVSIPGKQQNDNKAFLG
ncbi:MAG: hypothetical protein AABY33_00620 [Pseudomonadota bacterium]